MKKTLKTVIVTLLFLTLAASTALLAYLHFFASEDSGLAGEWVAELDLTERAAVSAYSWLQDIEGVSLSLEEVESYIPELTIEVSLIFAQADESTGTFACQVSPESYEACRKEAYAALTAAFHDLLAKRLAMAGYAGGTDGEALEALVMGTFGMSTEDYLASCGPELLPSLEELQAQYEGGGSYEMTEDVLTRRFEEDGTVVTRAEIYIRQDESLILMGETDGDTSGLSSDEYPVVYTLQQSAE